MSSITCNRKAGRDPLTAERVIIGAVLTDRAFAAKVSDLLCGRDFVNAANAIIFDAVVTLWRAEYPADLCTLAAWLNETNVLNAAGGSEALAVLAAQTNTDPALLRRYVISVKRAALERQVAEIKQTLKQYRAA